VSNRALDKNVTGLAPDALRVLQAHDWPGNVRELQNAIRYAVIQAVGDVLTADCLPAALRGGPTAPPGTAAPLDVVRFVRDLLATGAPDIYRTVIVEVDRVALAEVLRHVNNNQVQASELLGISRTTLRAKLQSMNLLGPSPG